MEPNSYQKDVLKDLDSYLSYLDQSNNVRTAYELHWYEYKHVKQGSIVPYNDTIPGVPHVCFKVPTGGGKTFLACCALRHIYDTMPGITQRVVVWLVPSNTILEQTVHNLSDPQHPYYQRLQRDFGSKITIYTKEQLLDGQNFTPSSVMEHVSICIMSFDSLRSAKKDGRKVYQQNGNLEKFAESYHDPSILLADTDETALIQVFRYLMPVVIVDESHNAQSELSTEMLNNLNPCFVLDLTATPRSNSNVISCVDPSKLKDENMVKLPIVVFNRATTDDVVLDAIKLRGDIERQAKAEQGVYIRPIVLFQAQPRGSVGNETFQKLKAKLVEKGIPKEQIAIKTADVNELKNENLQSPNCQIRYIITIDALKEGWDCPFAYILATLANKSSSVDVQQIVGRILRQPYACTYSHQLLNTSYVLTSSDAFFDTLQKLIDGLKLAGFTKDEYRLGNPSPGKSPVQASDIPEQTKLDDNNDNNDILPDLNADAVHHAMDGFEGITDPTVKRMEEQQRAAVEAYQKETKEQESSGLIGGELGEMINQIKFRPSVSASAEMLAIPQFCVNEDFNFLNEGYTLLTKESLSEGFSLNIQPADVNFETTGGDAYVIDLREDEEVPKYKRMQNQQMQWFQNELSRDAPEGAKKRCAEALANIIGGKKKTIPEQHILQYILRVLDLKDAEMISAIGGNLPFYASKILKRINELENQYRKQFFRKKLFAQEIFCRPTYRLPKLITPSATTDAIDKSLYTEEKDDMNGLERAVISQVTSCNIVWWHRIMERGPGEFYINGFIHEYPDFMILTQKGNLVLLETKGNDRDNLNSEDKLYLGSQWASKAGEHFQYFMVFDKNDPMEGALSIDDFISILQKL